LGRGICLSVNLVYSTVELGHGGHLIRARWFIPLKLIEFPGSTWFIPPKLGGFMGIGCLLN